MPSQLLRGSAAEATTHLTLAFNGTVPSNAIYSSYTAEFARVGEFALANSFAASYANETNAALTTRVLTNLGVTADTIGASSYATLASAVETAFAAYPTARGQVSLNLVRLLSGLEGDVTYGVAATAWNNNAAAAFTYSSNTANTTATTLSALGTPTAKTYFLSSGADRGVDFTGGAANDTYEGIQATASTFNFGDILDGGAGNDVLNLMLRPDPSSVDAVTLRNIETVNADVEATDATGGQLDASNWTGVSVLTNEGSTAGSLLSVSGLALTTQVRANGNTDVSIAYRGDLSGSADTVSVSVSQFGTGTGTTTTDSGAITLATGIEALNLAAVGTAYVTVEAGGTLTTINVSSTNAMTFVTDELLTAFNATALSGTSDFTFSGTSDIAFAGGAGNDTIRLGTTLSNGDNINGGAGTDTVRASIGSDVSLNATSVEALVATFTDSTADLTLTSAQSIIGINVSAVGGVGASIINFAGGTVTLADDNLSAISLDTVANAAVSVTLGTATTNGVDIASARFSDMGALTIQSIGGTGSANIANTLTLVNLTDTVTALTITAQGVAGITMSDLNASGLVSLDVVALASGSANIDGGFVSTAIDRITLRAIGSTAADITITNNIVATKDTISAISVEASAGATVTVSGIDVGTAASGGTLSSVITLNAGVGSNVAIAGQIDATGDALTLNAIAGQSAVINVSSISYASAARSGSTITLGVSASLGTGAVVDIAGVSGTGTDLNLSVGAVSVGAGADLGLFTAGAGFSTASLGRITLGESATAQIGSLVGSALDQIALTVGTAANASFGDIGVSALNTVSISISTGGSASFADITGTYVGDSTITVGTAGELSISSIVASTVGPITLTLRTAATATITEFGSGGAAFSGLAATLSSAANLTIASADFNGGSIATSTFTIGTAATAAFTTLQAGSMAKVTVAGAGTLQLPSVLVSAAAAIDLSGHVGSATIAFVTAQTARATVTGGAGTLVLTLPNAPGAGANTVVLASATGTDTIRYVSSQTDTGAGVDQISNFEVGSGGDVVVFGSGMIFRDAGGVTASTAATATDLSVVITGATTLAATDNVIVLGTAFANTAAMLSFIQTAITFATAFDGSGNLAVIYMTDDATASSKLAIVNVSGSASSTTLVSGEVSLVQTLANFTGVSAATWSAANISFGGG
jgi:hypothetical protein